MNEKIKHVLPVGIIILIVCIWAGITTGLYINTNRDLQSAMDSTKSVKSRLNTAEDILNRVIRQSREDYRNLATLRELLDRSRRNREAILRAYQRITEINEATRTGLVKCIGYSDRLIEGITESGRLLESVNTIGVD